MKSELIYKASNTHYIMITPHGTNHSVGIPRRIYPWGYILIKEYFLPELALI